MNVVDAPFKLVAVVWDDAETETGWDQPPDKLEHKLCLTVGFLIKQTKHHLMIASTCDAEKNTNGRIQIPRAMVKTLENL